ncbi:MAG TPA: hypothetical protein PKC45_09715 [Gemmatales bacterium]|nr:hypothetical protein [Gemmatales bacterium]
MILTARQKFVIRAALGYALSNADDINDALAVRQDGGTNAIRVGGIDGPPLEESELQALLAFFEPSGQPSAEEQRAFTGTFLVSLDPHEADEDAPDFTLDDLIDFLKGAVVLDVDTEDQGNPLGVQGVELLLDTLEERSADDVRHRP